MTLRIDDNEKEMDEKSLAKLLAEKSQDLLCRFLGLEVFDEQGFPVELEIRMKECAVA